MLAWAPAGSSSLPEAPAFLGLRALVFGFLEGVSPFLLGLHRGFNEVGLVLLALCHSRTISQSLLPDTENTSMALLPLLFLFLWQLMSMICICPFSPSPLLPLI